MKDIQKEIWNKAAYNKEFTTPLNKELCVRNINKEAEILDIGCGYGRTINELQNLGYTHVQGIDFSKKMIERAKQLYPKINVSVQKEKTIDFADNSLDAVLIFAVLTCITKDEEQDFLLQEAKRILRPGGIIYINDFLINQDERNCQRYETFYKKYNTYGIFELTDGLCLRHHSIERVKKCTLPFNCIHFETTSFPTMNGNYSNAYIFIGKK